MIEDTLYSRYAAFTVNTAIAKVALVLAAVPATREFTRITGGGYFAPNDNVIIDSIAVVLPFAFVSADDLFIFELGAHDSGGVDWPLTILGSGSQFLVHSENVEVTKSLYIPFSVSVAGLKWRPKVIGGSGSVCCLNAPAVLNAQVYDAIVSIRVKHTLSMIA